MANTQSIPTYQAWRTAVLTSGLVPMYPTSGLLAALFLVSATINGTTTAYTTSGEVSGAGYTAGGVAVTSATAPNVSGATAFWTPSALISFGTVTLATAFDCVMIYDGAASNRNLYVGTFGSQTVTAAPFTLTMPTNDATTGLVRVAWS